MKLAVIAMIAYGLLSGVGGIIGYKKSQSKPSLIAGLVSGVLLLLCAGLFIQGYSWGLIVSQIIIVGLMIVFAVRLRKSGKFMPAGMMLLTGVAALCCLLA